MDVQVSLFLDVCARHQTTQEASPDLLEGRCQHVEVPLPPSLVDDACFDLSRPCIPVRSHRWVEEGSQIIVGLLSSRMR